MSVRTRRTRLAVLAATAVLGATIPVLGGATSAWACGDAQPAASATASAPADAPAAEPKPEVGLLPRDARTITEGGAAVEFGVEVYNGGTEMLKGVQPFPTFSNDAGDIAGNLHAEDLVLQVAHNGVWKTIALKPGCDPTLRGDYSFLATDLAPGRATRFMFRLSVTSHSTAAQKQVDVRVGVQQPYQSHLRETPHFTLPIVHPAAPAPTATTKAPSAPAATPSAQTPAVKDAAAPAAAPAVVPAAAPAVVPAAAVESTTPSPASVPAGTVNLASTGGGSGSTPMLIGGTVLVLLGAGAVTLSARRRATRRG
ncbi:hypothetical protein [Kitasatospora sp. NPDC004531]